MGVGILGTLLVLLLKGGNETNTTQPNLSSSTPIDNHTLQILNYTSNSSLTTTEQITMTTLTINTTSTTRQPVTSTSGTNPTTTRPPPSTLITEIPKVIVANDDMGCGMMETIIVKYIYVC